MGLENTCLEFNVNRGRGDEERSPDSEESGIQEPRGPAEDKEKVSALACINDCPRH